MKQILIIHEGEKTEKNYIIELQRLARDENSNIVFVAKTIGGVKVSNYLSKVKEIVKKENGKLDYCFVWMDFDIFKRKNIDAFVIKNNIDEIKIPKKFKLTEKVKTIFNYMNCEDFLILHSSNENIKKWIEVCKKKNHFKTPMGSSVYMPEILKIFPEYKKSELPLEISLDVNLIKRLIATSNLFEIKSEFVKVFEILLKELKNE